MQKIWFRGRGGRAESHHPEGGIFHSLGPSGCGKTTTLRMIAGFYAPSQGRIHLDGKDVTEVPPQKRGTGMVFQNYALFPHMTVFENVAFGLQVRKISKPERKERVEQALDLVRLGGMGDRQIAQLSGGQQQRVALARALVIRPRILLLDEPLSNLDARLRDEMRSEILSLQRSLGITTIYVTHDQVEALSMSDRIAVFQQGSCRQIGTPEQIYNRPEDAFVASFIGETNLLPATVEAVNAEEIQVRSLGRRFRVEPRAKEKATFAPGRSGLSQYPSGRGRTGSRSGRKHLVCHPDTGAVYGIFFSLYGSGGSRSFSSCPLRQPPGFHR